MKVSLGLFDLTPKKALSKGRDCYMTIYCKYNSVLILRAGQLGALVKHTSRLEESKLVSNRPNLNHTSNKYHCKHNRVVLVLSANQSVNIDLVS